MGSQKQTDVKVEMLDGETLVGTKTGNNAAWLCSCKYEKPLIGSTLYKNPVECPGCLKKYKLHPEENQSGKSVNYVEQIE